MSIERLLFFDFDDTLYSHALGAIPAPVLERLRRLDGTRELFIVTTGRGPESVDFICNALGFRPPVLALLNGQLIFEGDKQVFEQFIALPSMGAIIERAEAHGFACGGYYRGGELVSRVNERVRAVWRRFGCPLPHVVPDFPKTHALYQGHLYIKKEEATIFGSLLDDYVTNWSDEYLMNLIPKAAGKANAVRWCMERWLCPRENTYAFGDGFNDVDMLLAVGHGIAIGNGTPSLAAAAELVVPGAAEGGLTLALEHYQIG